MFIAFAWTVPMFPSEFGFKRYAIAFALVVGGLGGCPPPAEANP
jgi:hypothetical protein